MNKDLMSFIPVIAFYNHFPSLQKETPIVVIDPGATYLSSIVKKVMEEKLEWFTEGDINERSNYIANSLLKRMERDKRKRIIQQ